MPQLDRAAVACEYRHTRSVALHFPKAGHRAAAASVPGTHPYMAMMTMRNVATAFFRDLAAAAAAAAAGGAGDAVIRASPRPSTTGRPPAAANAGCCAIAMACGAAG